MGMEDASGGSAPGRRRPAHLTDRTAFMMLADAPLLLDPLTETGPTPGRSVASRLHGGIPKPDPPQPPDDGDDETPPTPVDEPDEAPPVEPPPGDEPAYEPPPFSEEPPVGDPPAGDEPIDDPGAPPAPVDEPRFVAVGDCASPRA